MSRESAMPTCPGKNQFGHDERVFATLHAASRDRAHAIDAKLMREQWHLMPGGFPCRCEPLRCRDTIAERDDECLRRLGCGLSLGCQGREGMSLARPRARRSPCQPQHEAATTLREA